MSRLIPLAYEPEDVAPGWIALVIVLLLAIATFLLWRSMNHQLAKIKVPKRDADADDVVGADDAEAAGAAERVAAADEGGAAADGEAVGESGGQPGAERAPGAPPRDDSPS